MRFVPGPFRTAWKFGWWWIDIVKPMIQHADRKFEINQDKIQATSKGFILDDAKIQFDSTISYVHLI